MRITLVLTFASALSGICAAQSWQPPTVAQRFPSKWGAGDQRWLKLDELAAKRVYEFAFMMQPLKLQGAAGSTVAPVAVR